MLKNNINKFDANVKTMLWSYEQKVMVSWIWQRVSGRD